MDEDDDAQDNTAVIRMTKEFDDFTSQNKSHSRKGGLRFQGSFIDRSMSENAFGGLSMQDVFSKEAEKRTDLLQAKSEIARLEHEVNTLNMSRKRARVEFDKDIDHVKQNYQKEIDGYSSLRHELHQAKAKETETREELVVTRKALEEARDTLEGRVLTLQKDRHRIETETQETEQLLGEMVSELKSDVLRVQTELHICQDRLQESQQQHAMSKKRYADVSQKLEEMDDLSIRTVDYEHKIRELEQKLARVEEDNTIAKAMKSQLDKTLQLEKDNMKLREDNTYYMEKQENILILREQNVSLKVQLENMQQRCHELEKIQPHYQELKKKVEKWEVKDAKGASRSLSPTRMSATIAELQNSNAVLLAKQGKLMASLHACRVDVKGRDSDKRELGKAVNLEQQKVLHLAEQIKRLQKRLLLAIKERDGYKRIIDSYESEVTVNMATATAQRLAELEQVNESYHRHVDELEKNISNKSEFIAELNYRCYQLERLPGVQGNQSLQQVPDPDEERCKVLLSLREKIAELEKTVEKLSEEKYVLEGRMERVNSQGDYDPTKTKVLHFSMNPHALAQRQRAAQLSKLQEENQRLIQRLQVLEEAEGTKVENLTVVVDERLQEPSSSKQVDGLKQQLTSAELKNKRLVEAFSKTSQEFREVCYQLLGYKIDIPVSNQYRLLSMYASSPEDSLLFQQAPNGEMQMLGTDFSHNFEEKMKMYLHGANSIPAFLSSISLELFNSQTMMQ